MSQTIRLSAAALALAAGLAAAPQALAQEGAGESALRPGASSITLGIAPDPSVGFWTMPSGRTALGLVGSLQGNRTSLGGGEVEQTMLVLSPQLKRYRSTRGAILPYLHGSVFASLADFESRNPSGSGEGRIRALGASAAVGLDWFPARRAALGGHAGLGLSRTLSEAGPDGAARFETTTWLLQTFTAAIQVQLYL
jgi:hypothetical protein